MVVLKCNRSNETECHRNNIRSRNVRAASQPFDYRFRTPEDFNREGERLLFRAKKRAGTLRRGQKRASRFKTRKRRLQYPFNLDNNKFLGLA